MRHLRIPVSTVLAMLMLLAIAMPAFGYHDPNVRDLRIRRLDPIQCGQPITLEATVWRRGGGTVSGVEVNWSVLAKGNRIIVPGDTLVPTTSVSDADGRAYAELTLVCVDAKRLVEAEHPGDARDRITIECNKRKCAGNENHEEVESFLPTGPADPKLTGSNGAPMQALGVDLAAAMAPPAIPLPLNLVTLMAIVAAALFVTRGSPLWQAMPRRAGATA